MKKTLLDSGSLVICGGASITWLVRLATWAATRPTTPQREPAHHAFDGGVE
jgi:hypothetical protein